MSKIKTFILATATLSGTIIGVGIFSLPYIASQVGIVVMAGYFFILGFFVLLIHYLYADVALATPDFLRLPGYAKLYLGNWARSLALLSLAIGSFGSLLAYLIVGGEFLRNLFSDFLGGSVFFYTFLYFALGALSILIGVKAIVRIEFWGLILFLAALVFLFFKGMPLFRPENLLAGNFNLQNIFLPIGPIIFSLWGATMIPEIEEILIGDKKSLKKVILISILIAAVVYALFTVFILGISGRQTSEFGLTGLAGLLSQGVLRLGFLFGFLATFTSFIIVGLYLKNMLYYDFKIPKISAWFLVSFIPIILFLAGLKDFINIIGFVGSITLVIEGILVLLMYKKIKRKIK
ncbi:MAG: aromatic amino acid transport family protein [Patescibacteria group bacterium]